MTKQNIRFWLKDNLIFLSIAFLFGFCMIFIAYFGDDAVYKSQHLSVCISSVLSGYYNWSSRQLVNIGWMLILHGGRVAFGLYMGLSMFVLLKSLEILFVTKPNPKIKLFICFLVMLYPYQILSTAGWVATATSYFGPATCGIAALIPIRRIYEGKKISFPAFIGYSLLLLYGTNLEQMMAVLLAVYVVAFVWFAVKKQLNVYLCLLTCLVALSAVYTLTCPGNSARSVQEISNWFPTYPMFDVVDKFDLGITTTLYWMFFESNLLVTAICTILALFVWNRYDDAFFRAIAAIPVGICILVGPLQTATAKFFPYLACLANSVHTNGSFTVECQGLGMGAMQFAVMLLLCICIFISIILISDTLESFVVCCVLMGAGIGSRVVIGFSPTLYASSTRTYSVLLICIISLMVHLAAHSSSYFKQNSSNRISSSQIYGFFIVTIVLSFMNLFILVYGFGRYL